MVCARRSGLFLSILKAMDNLGLDIQQAVINDFIGFALDVIITEVAFLLCHYPVSFIVSTISLGCDW